LNAHPNIDWKAIRGTGNFLRHEYDQVDPELIWTIVTKRFPELVVVVDRLIADIG
jgi:uncharacterized protein with HEPN domain